MTRHLLTCAFLCCVLAAPALAEDDVDCTRCKGLAVADSPTGGEPGDWRGEVVDCIDYTFYGDETPSRDRAADLGFGADREWFPSFVPVGGVNAVTSGEKIAAMTARLFSPQVAGALPTDTDMREWLSCRALFEDAADAMQAACDQEGVDCDAAP